MPLSKTINSLPLYIATLCGTTSAHAEFVLDFMPDDGFGLGTVFVHGQFGSDVPGATPFLMRGSLQLPEIVVDPDTGLDYFHIVMGDPAEGFMQDVYIERGFTSFQGGAGSAVGGGGFGNNNRTPLGPNAANGQANPRKTLVRQVVSDGEIYMDFIKDKFDRKPKITQILSLPKMSSIFQLDMGNSTYGDDLTPGVLFLTQYHTDDYQDEASFNYATDVQKSNIEGGRFTYNNGSGPGGSAGTYIYAQGDFDADSPTWEAYFDHSQANHWSYPIERPTPP